MIFGLVWEILKNFHGKFEGRNIFIFFSSKMTEFFSLNLNFL